MNKHTNNRDLFKNQVRSEVRMFRFGDACLPPDGLSTDGSGPSFVRLSWQGDPLHSEYSVQYREQGQTDWYGQRTITPQVQINNLKPGTTYEYQVQATCGINSSDYSAVSRANTAEEAVGQFACGVPTRDAWPQPPPNEPLLQFLAPNDVIYYHKFKIITKSVTSSAGGRFSGEGIAEIPFLNYSSVRVNFVGIAVTQSRVVVRGIVESIYNPNSKVIYVTDKP
ncbi:MAG: fibronectin type III domain-containing protein, partial [Cyclobacteriaceae bacterium]|nr:fibronectin type III domain-containing protein [Chitinophagaceae bacterium]MBY0436057.1 fibronectin type III domain-containing protein [Cyclobacteriaceae bacterium]